MKRHHIVAIFSFIFGGLFACVQFYHGDTDRAIRTGIICIIVGIVALFYEKLRTLAQTGGSRCALSLYYRVNGGSCGVHGGYSGKQFSYVSG